MLRRQLLAIALASLGLCVLVLVGLNKRATLTDAFFEQLLGASESVSVDVLVSAETAVATGSTTDLGVGLRLGDALVRWQLAKRRGNLEQHQLSGVASELQTWLAKTELRGSGKRWAQALRDEESTADPSGAALRSLQRSLPDDAVEAGRWLAALRLWPQTQHADLGLPERKAAFGILDGAGLLWGVNVNPAVVELLSQDELTRDDLYTLRGLATELILDNL